MRPTTISVFVALTAVCLTVVGAVRAADEAHQQEAVDTGSAQAGDDSSNQTSAKDTDETRLQELVVEAQRPLSAASSRELRARDFMTRPHLTMMQVLNNIPGLLVSQHQGGSKAPQWFLRGFHSNDARSTVTGSFTGSGPSGTGVVAAPEPTPLVKALGYELGARTRLFDRVDLAAAVWNLNLESELVFSGDAGTDEASSLPSRRYGVDFEARWQITDWLYADYDLSWSHARFSDGSFVPLAVPIFMNGGFTADFHNGLTLALRGRYVSDRPGNEGDTVTARGYYLLDLFGRYRWRNLELSLQLLNFTNTDWREAQFADNSCVRSEEQSRNPKAPCFSKPGKSPVTPPGSIHFTPGNPIGVVAGTTWFF